MSAGKRVNLGGYEFVAAEVPASRRGGGATIEREVELAVQALDQLRVECVLMVSEVSPSWASTRNKAAKRLGVGVKFLARSTGKGKADIYVARHDWTEAAA